jgi:hypothetical protein
MDKVMKRLGIEVVELRGNDVKLIMHCNSKGKLVCGHRNSWCITLRRYALNLNYPTIDDIRKQPLEEFEAIKEALKLRFEYLDYPLAFKHVKDQLVVSCFERWERVVEEEDGKR